MGTGETYRRSVPPRQSLEVLGADPAVLPWLRLAVQQGGPLISRRTFGRVLPPPNVIRSAAPAGSGPGAGTRRHVETENPVWKVRSVKLIDVCRVTLVLRIDKARPKLGFLGDTAGRKLVANCRKLLDLGCLVAVVEPSAPRRTKRSKRRYPTSQERHHQSNRIRARCLSSSARCGECCA